MVVKCILNVFGFFPSSRPTFIEYCCMFQYQPVPASWAVASTLAWVLALRPTPIVLTHDFPCSFFDVRTCFHVHWNLGQTTVRARASFSGILLKNFSTGSNAESQYITTSPFFHLFFGRISELERQFKSPFRGLVERKIYRKPWIFTT